MDLQAYLTRIRQSMPNRDLEEALMALIDIRDGSAYDEVAKARASIALERLGID